MRHDRGSTVFAWLSHGFHQEISFKLKYEDLGEILEFHIKNLLANFAFHTSALKNWSINYSNHKFNTILWIKDPLLLQILFHDNAD